MIVKVFLRRLMQCDVSAVRFVKTGIFAGRPVLLIDFAGLTVCPDVILKLSRYIFTKRKIFLENMQKAVES